MSLMAKRWTCFFLFRLLLPLALIAAAVVRFSGFSLLYLLLLMTAPLLPSPSPLSMAGRTGKFMLASVVLCALTLTAQVVFQAYLLIVATDEQPFGTILKNCSMLERSLRQLGLQRLEPNNYGDILRVILPDIGAFLFTLVVFLICRRLLPRPTPHQSTGGRGGVYQRHSSLIQSRIQNLSRRALDVVGNFLVALFLAASAIANPSALNGVYFMAFLVLTTWWACYKSLGRRFAGVRVALLVYSGAHLVTLYLYQFQFFQDALSPADLKARVLGLTALVLTDCRKPWMLELNPKATWPMYVSPAFILLLYFITACEIRRYCEKVGDLELTNIQSSPTLTKQTSRGGRSKRSSASERQSLVEEEHPSYNSLDPAETTSITPQVDVYGGGVHSEDESPGGVTGARPAQGDTASQTAEKARKPIVSVFVYIMKQSYVCTIVVMMAWSITYHSWLTFVFLIAACLIWMLPQKRRVCLAASPIILCYAWGLLTAQYIYGFNLSELPLTTPDGTKYSEIGLVKDAYPIGRLAVQVGFTVVFLMCMRQQRKERFEERNETRVSQDLVDGYDRDSVKAFGRWLWRMLCKYWILVCAILLLVMAIQEAVIYRIIYMALFAYFIITFQLCYRWWRLTIYVFWWVVIIYSMGVLLCIYTYQFEAFPGYWHNGTGMSPELVSDIGLEQFDTATLFVKLLTPTSFVIIICIQLHYFQQPLLKLSDINRFRKRLKKSKKTRTKRDDGLAADPVDGEAEPEDRVDAGGPEAAGGAAAAAQDGDQSKEGQEGEEDKEADVDPELKQEVALEMSASKKQLKWHQRLGAWCQRSSQAAYACMDKTSVYIWRLLEIHMIKIVMFTIFMCCMAEVCAINVVLVILVLAFMPVAPLSGLLSHLCQCWALLAILAKMMYQLRLVPRHLAITNCTDVMNMNTSAGVPYPFNESIDNAVYLGLERTNNLPGYLTRYVLIVCVLGFEAIVKLHQLQYYLHPERQRPAEGIVFPEVRRADADSGLIPCAKFFVNYTFYKFGLQICFIMTMVTMVVRLDAYSVIYGVFLGVLLAMNRRHCYIMWPVYIIVLLVFLILQYLSCLGVPIGLCWGYPWDEVSAMTVNLKIYLYLPSYLTSPDAYLLVADFFQLLFVCLQWRVFRLENNGREAEIFGGGSNKSILREVTSDDDPNPVQDFLYCKDSYLDYIKAALFQYSFWVTLVIVFIAGTAKISLFCLGYLVGFFFFLWFGMELLTKPLHKVVRLWGILLSYSYFVILMKSCLQLVGCVYLSRLAKHYCWVIQLLGLGCLRAGNYLYEGSAGEMGSCSQSEDEAGLTWDAICFVFLLLQLRIYKSHYFRHVVLELVVQNQLASRGAELINTDLIREVAEQKSKEYETLRQIKRKMDRIREKQDRIQQKALLEADNHYAVIRSGDYYMFEEDSDDDGESSVDVLEPEAGSDDEDKAGPLQILNAAVMGGTKEALQVAERQKTSSSSESGDPRTPSKDPSRLSYGGSPRSSTRDSATEEPSQTPVDEAQPSTSRLSEGERDTLEGCDEGEEDEEEEVTHKETCGTKFKNAMRLVWTLIGSFLDYLISFFRKISQKYRKVSHILDREKEEEKRKRREDPSDTEPGTSTTQDRPRNPSGEKSSLIVRRPQDIAIVMDLEDAKAEKDRLQTEESLEYMEGAERKFRRSMPRILQLLIAILEAVMSRSELLCYFAMILNHLINASLLSLAYPLSVFLWAMLSVPRPSKTYWVTVITYTEAVVVIKYLFQFGFFPWNNRVGEGPFWPPRIIGIEKESNYAAFDLVLLFCLFVHRSILKRHGLWKDATDLDADFDAAEDKVVTTPSATPVSSPPAVSKTSEPTSKAGGTDNATYDATPSHPSASVFPEEGGDGDELALVGGTKDIDRIDDKEDKDGCCSVCCNPFIEFYRAMTNPRYCAVTDVYALMFFCDFIAFLIIVFGYWAFGPVESTGAAGTEVVTTVIQDNKVPAPFLAMLLVQFVLIIVDRALYLRKNVIGKFLFQISLVILVHVWMFFILPAVTNRPFTDNMPAKLWYFIKCVYFGLSAYQIRSGYPTRILGNFLTKKYNYVNLFLFKGFLMIPFLLELRALMDWMWTDTTLALTSWLKMEDIYANIFELKCWRRAEEKYPTPRGRPRKMVVKYGLGGLLLFVLIFIIWFPLLLFSLANAVFEPNPPIDCTIEMKFGGYQPIFTMSAQQISIRQMSQSAYNKLRDDYDKNAGATAFLATYEPKDIYVAEINGVSTSTWEISPPSEAALIHSLSDVHTDISLYTSISFTREPKSGMTSETVTNQFVRNLNASQPEMRVIREALVQMINGTYNNTVLISNMFPPDIQVPVSGKPSPAAPLLTEKGSWSNITFRLNKHDDVMWWELQDDTVPTPSGVPGYSKTPENSLTLVSFNERIAPGALTFFTSYGIIGLYLSVILVIGRVLRVQTSGMTQNIMFNFLPNVDRVWKLIRELYLVRETKEYRLEEELFARLMFLYRSPETLIKVTKYQFKDKVE